MIQHAGLASISHDLRRCLKTFDSSRKTHRIKISRDRSLLETNIVNFLMGIYFYSIVWLRYSKSQDYVHGILLPSAD